MATITRIKEFIRRQRLIGENQFGNKMRKRYDKTAKEFYDQFADKVYYEKNGVKYGLDIQTLWYFRTNDMIKDERGHTVDLKSGDCNLHVVSFSEAEVCQLKQSEYERGIEDGKTIAKHGTVHWQT